MGSYLPLEGTRVVEVAAFMAVPSAGRVLADWGAEVIKIEDPEHGDPLRGLTTATVGRAKAATNDAMTHAMRGKRSVALDVSQPAGQQVLYRLIRDADVFLTSLRPGARRRFNVDVPDIRAVNPSIIYARGSGVGPRGPERDKGGFDFASFWARSGIASVYHRPELEYPPPQNPAFGDLFLGIILAGGVAAAIAGRQAGKPAPVVDTSLLAAGLWPLSIELLAAASSGGERMPLFARGDRRESFNPLVNTFRTKDGRFLVFVLIDGTGKRWAELCHCLGHPELIDDDRFNSSAARFENRTACVDVLDEIFATRTLDEWKDALRDIDGVWETVQDVFEVHEDPQVIANEYLLNVSGTSGDDPQATPFPYAVAPPVQFNEEATPAGRVQEHGEDTEAVLLEAGYDWPELVELKSKGVIL
jgi:crotonobetainyl-CoA:carnitine CoA-transferase CaiB-like acyl-CoA transferase